MNNPYSRLIVRLDGRRLSESPELYAELVKKGIGGFIVFGGDIEKLREGLRFLQGLSEKPLIICSDLEQGLGQQVKGGSIFPSAMAMGYAYRNDPYSISLIESAFRHIAREALYTGINTILAPVMDIQNNPLNPIISIRSFGVEPEIVSLLGTLMIRVFNEEGVLSCAKHFPGHGDTVIDSHHALPVIRKSVERLSAFELIPFKRAIESGVSMIMMGHILATGIDTERPVSISEKAVRFLRDMGFEGLIITDAMNMGALSDYGELDSSELAMAAGVDLILHPEDPHGVARRIVVSENRRLERLYPLLSKGEDLLPDFGHARIIARKIYEKALTVSGDIPDISSSALVIINDEISGLKKKGAIFAKRFAPEDLFYINSSKDIDKIPKGKDLLLAVFSRPGAFKRPLKDFKDILNLLAERARLIISFGNPFILQGIEANVIYIYDDTELAELVVADFLFKALGPGHVSV
ncbi:MAG: glycoside hydrolase family 3 N-terminal domain-containing protein [Thermodesulfovibrionales bacterium]